MRLRRPLTVAALELRTAVAGPLFWALVVLAVLAATVIDVTTFTGAAGSSSGLLPFVNSQHAMAWLFAMSGFLLYGFFSSLLAGTATIRDHEHRVAELLQTTGLTRLEYLGGKLAGALAAAVLALLLHLVCTVLLFQLGSVAAGLARGPFHWGSYLVPVLLFPLPMIWFCGGLAFAIGERTRQPIAVFALPIAVFSAIVWLISWAPAELSPTVDRLLMVVDPSGLRWLLRTVLSVDRGVAFYNASPLPFDAVFALNRVWTLALPLMALGWTARARSGAVPRRGGSRGARRRTWPPADDHAPATVAVSVATLEMTSAPPTALVAALQIARVELRELRRQPGLYVFVPLLMLMVWDAASAARGPYDTAVLLTAGRLATEAHGVLVLLSCLILLFYVAQSLAREETAGVAPLLYSSPVSTRTILLGKTLASLAVAAVLLLGCFAVATVVLARGPSPFELVPLALVWGLVLGPTLVLWIAFVTALYALVRGLPATYALGLAALGASLYHLRSDSISWVGNWTLLGALRWSDLGTFALNREPLVLNRLLILGAALFLAAVAARWFPRVEGDVVTRWRPRPETFWRDVVRLAGLAAVPAILAGFLALEIRAGFQGATAERQTREYRRLNLATWQDVEPPHVLHVDLAVELEPAARAADVEGTFLLVNPTDAPMPRLPFTVGPDFEDVRWRVAGEPAATEDRAGLHVLRLETPLAPGREIRVGFAYRLTRPRGFTHNGGGVEQFVLPSGVLLHTLRDSFLPVPGFVPSVGLDPELRLEPAELSDDFWRAELGPGAGSLSPFTGRSHVTAPAGYTVVGTGRKTGETVRDGRVTTVWETGYPVRVLALVAGHWQVRRRGDVAVYFHPTHDANVDDMLATLAAARDHYSRWFYPYPWDELRLAEFSGLTTNALGFATTIAFSESIGFLSADRSTVGPAFLVTAHEAAHQWWGNLVAPAAGPGTDHLVEGMAHFSALLLAETTHGAAARAELARRMERSYCESRRTDVELPLIETVDDRRPSDRAVVYDKGAWVMWMLREELGRERFLAGLESFVERFLNSRDHPATQDLIESLRPYAPDPETYRSFVDRWFYRVTLPEFQVSARSAVRSDRGWRVDVTVTNVGSGGATVEVAVVTAAAPPRRERRFELWLEPGAAETTTLELEHEPERVIVDPDANVLQCARHLAVADVR